MPKSHAPAVRQPRPSTVRCRLAVDRDLYEVLSVVSAVMWEHAAFFARLLADRGFGPDGDPVGFLERSAKRIDALAAQADAGLAVATTRRRKMRYKRYKRNVYHA